MIVDIANLRDGAERWFWHKWERDYIQTSWNRSLTEYRNELRAIWAVPLSRTHTQLTLADIRLRTWLVEAQAHSRQTWVFWSGCVYPDYRNLPLSLAVAVSELAPQMAKCENPECPSTYFLRGRKTQRFCDRPACIAYGQREHKRKWWNQNRGKRRKGK
jgi:hypothetical protein